MYPPQPIEPRLHAKVSALGLRRVRLLEDLDAAALEALAQQCRWRHCARGERVVSRDASDADVYLVVSGKLRSTAFSPAGRQVTFREMAAGDWFGDLSAIDGKARAADVDAIDDSVLAAMRPCAFLRLVEDHPKACRRVLDRLADEVRELTDRVIDCSTQSVRQRLEAELLRLARQAGVAGNAARIDPAPMHSDIAARISTYREQVTRELSAMARQGLVERSCRALVVTDVARLQRMVTDTRAPAPLRVVSRRAA